jgi:NAD(P)H-hydrate epimerase
VQLPVVGAWDSRIAAALDELPRANVVVAGPGLGRSGAAVAFASALWKKWDKPLLMDGDALYALATIAEDLSPRANSVLTPHEGEAARLLGWTPEEVRENREEAVQCLSKRWGCVLLKGEGTLLAAFEKRARLDQGGAELSVPGSGDVLSGCIGTFLAQGLKPFEAACLGGILHGMAGRRIRESRGVDGVLASEIADGLPFVIGSLRALRA